MPRVKKRSVVIYGRGRSSEFAAPDGAIVIRLKRDPKPCDVRVGRSVIFQGKEPFWHFNDPPKWIDYYRRFSSRKPSTGLCAVFLASEKLNIGTLYLAGFDNLLDGVPIPGHDMRAELEALNSLGLNIVDARECGAVR